MELIPLRFKSFIRAPFKREPERKEAMEDVTFKLCFDVPKKPLEMFINTLAWLANEVKPFDVPCISNSDQAIACQIIFFMMPERLVMQMKRK